MTANSRTRTNAAATAAAASTHAPGTQGAASKAAGAAQNIATGIPRMVAEVVKLTKPVMSLVAFDAKRRSRETAFVLREWITEQAVVFQAKLDAELKRSGAKTSAAIEAMAALPAVHSPATRTKDVLVTKVVKLPRTVLNLATYEAQRRDRSRAFIVREWVTAQAEIVRAEIEREQASKPQQQQQAAGQQRTKRVSKRA